MIIHIETPTEKYPMGSECPLHRRVHNSHGWYVCVTSDASKISKMLFELRERLDMQIDMTERRTSQRDVYGRRLLHEVDVYRAEQGWSPHGFGGET